MPRDLGIDNDCVGVPTDTEFVAVRAEESHSDAALAVTGVGRLGPMPLLDLKARHLIRDGRSGSLLRCSGERHESMKQQCFAERQSSDVIRNTRLAS